MSTKFIFDQQLGINDNFTYNSISSGTSNTTAITITAADTNANDWFDYKYYRNNYEYPNDYRYNRTKVKVDNKPVNVNIINSFPFKRNNYLGFAEQLQGEFDKWAGSIKQDLFR